jgi:hypothetical protein
MATRLDQTTGKSRDTVRRYNATRKLWTVRRRAALAASCFCTHVARCTIFPDLHDDMLARSTCRADARNAIALAQAWCREMRRADLEHFGDDDAKPAECAGNVGDEECTGFMLWVGQHGIDDVPVELEKDARVVSWEVFDVANKFLYHHRNVYLQWVR